MTSWLPKGIFADSAQYPFNSNIERSQKNQTTNILSLDCTQSLKMIHHDQLYVETTENEGIIQAKLTNVNVTYLPVFLLQADAIRD